MTSFIFLIWMTNLLFDTVGQLSFKAAATKHSGYAGLNHWKDMAKRPWIWFGFICYIAEFITWIAFLSVVDLSIGVMLASIDMVVIMVAGRILFREDLTPWRLAGLVLISAGVIFVGMEV